MAENTSTGGEDQERHDVKVIYTNGEEDVYTGVDGDTARDLENATFTLPGVARTEARTQR